MKTFGCAVVCLVLLVAASGCESDSPTDPTPACTYTLSTTSLAFGPAGGPSSVGVAAGAGCSWTATSDRTWMVVAGGGTGAGNGTVTLNVTENTATAQRTGTLTVAGQAVAVRQDGLAPCSIDISPGSASFNKDSATGTFAVSAAAHCEWRATSNAGWVAVTSGQGAGSGTVAYSVERNRSTTSRTGTITVAERTFTVMQSGDLGVCEYSVTPVQFSPCMSVSFDLTATITTQSECTWTTAPGAPWITMTGDQAGTGSGVVRFRVADNWDAPRQGVVLVRWPAPTEGQNLQVRQAGCFYAVSVNSISIAAAGGAGRFDVIQSSDPISCGGPLQNACLWTAESTAPWITITTSMPQAGDNPVSFTVAPNVGATARTGTIRVRDRIVSITQGGS